jgi:hypothetical protein
VFSHQKHKKSMATEFSEVTELVAQIPDNQGFATFDTHGNLLRHEGVFSGNEPACRSAFSMVEHCTRLLKREEGLKRITAQLDGATLIATVTKSSDGKPLVVVVMRKSA